MDNTWSMEIGMRIILDVIDIIKKVKKKKAERTLIFREAEALGLDYDDTASFLQALQEREILLEEDNVFTVVEKERQQVIKGLVNLFKTFSKPITEIKDAATEVSTDFTQDSNNEHHSGSEIEIIRSLSNLADVIVRLQGIIDEERSRSHSLLEENFELKSQQIAIENKTGKRSQAQQWHQSLSNAYPKNKRNKSTFKSRTKTPIIYEDIHSDESREISASRANIGIKLENKRKQGQDQSLKSIGNNQASQKAAKTTKTSEKMTSEKENNNNSNNTTNVNNDIEAQKRTGKKENYSSKTKVKFNNKSHCERAEESQNTEKTGGQQIEKPSQKIKITIVGDSQLKRLDETKLSK